MLVRVCWVFVLVLAIVFACAAQSRVATVTGSESLQLRGVTVPAGVPSWPVFPGDTISTATSTAIITTPDGGRITLNSNSQATLSSSSSVRLDSGSIASASLEGQGKGPPPWVPPPPQPPLSKWQRGPRPH